MHRWVFVLAVACGPVAYVNQVTMKADDAVAAAAEVDAEKYAPYWWTRAKEYLHMAREVAAHADYQGANRFGRLATEAAIKAREEAEIAAKDPSKRPIPEPRNAIGGQGDATKPADAQPAPPVAPAKETP